MVRRSAILNKKPDIKISPNYLYCTYKKCPLNSLYECDFCKNTYCVNHVKINNFKKTKTTICIDCHYNNENYYNVFNALENNEIEIKTKTRKWLYYLSLVWINCYSNDEI